MLQQNRSSLVLNIRSKGKYSVAMHRSIVDNTRGARANASIVDPFADVEDFNVRRVSQRSRQAGTIKFLGSFINQRRRDSIAPGALLSEAPYSSDEEDPLVYEQEEAQRNDETRQVMWKMTKNVRKKQTIHKQTVITNADDQRSQDGLALKNSHHAQGHSKTADSNQLRTMTDGFSGKAAPLQSSKTKDQANVKQALPIALF